jgi:AraC-like DNA-binding protein
MARPHQGSEPADVQSGVPGHVLRFSGAPAVVRPDPLAGDAGSFAAVDAHRRAGAVAVALERFRPLAAPVLVENPLLRVARHLATPLRFCSRSPMARAGWVADSIGPGQHFVFAAESAGCFHWDEAFRTFSITLDTQALGFTGRSRLPGGGASVRAHDQMLERLTASLLQDAEEGFLRGDSFIEGVGLAIAAHLAGPSAQAREAPISDAELRRLREAVEAMLGERIGLAPLARLLDVPARRLGPGFRAATGQSLWHYVLERRIARAECLMRETDRSLAAIALACGFSSQAHFTTAFRRLRGVTPGIWRRRAVPG